MILSKIENIKSKTKKYYNQSAEANRIRSRVQMFEEDEKSSSYFYNIEIKNGQDKSWTCIKLPDGTYSNNLDIIIKEQTRFYKHLYTSEGWDEQEGNKLIGNIEHVLSETEKSKIENEIQKEEIFNAVKSFKLNKSPGEDGIIAEFYQTYWYLINEDLLELFNYEFETFALTPSQHKGIITLLYKKGEREEIKNWRPLTMLNVDYKDYGRIKLIKSKTVSKREL